MCDVEPRSERRKAMEEVEKHFVSLENAFGKMQESLQNSRREGSEKAKGEGKEVLNRFKKATYNRLQAREDEMTYEQAKAVHEGYLNGLNGLQEWHARCLKVLSLSPELRIRLAIDFTAGMSYLHTRSPPIIHRDLKTPNVLLCSVDPHHNGPLAKVSDFGASAQMFMTSLQSGNIGSSDKAKKHVVTLTTWLAPEILLGQPYSKPSDVYAVGIMLWELLTRRHPFDHLGSVMNEVKVRQKVPSDDEDNRPPVPPDGPEDYCNLMRACWDGNPEARPKMEHALVALIEMAQKIPSLSKVVNAKELLATFDYEETPREEIPLFNTKKANKNEKKSPAGTQKEAQRKLEGKFQTFGDEGGKKGEKKETATTLALAEFARQVWVGMADGSLKIYNLTTGKIVAEKKEAHQGAVICLLYVRGKVWSGGEDMSVKIWGCMDIQMDVPNKTGYLSKLSPSSKMVWQKRYFVLDGNSHELRYAENSKTTKIKGSVSLRIPDLEVQRRQRQPSLTQDDFGAFFSQVGYSSKLSRDDSGTSARVGSSSSSSSSGSLSSFDDGVMGYDVSVANVVTSKNKFKVVTRDRVFTLKALNDDKNAWMAAIMGAILKPIQPIHQIWLDQPPSCLSHIQAGTDEKSENILISTRDMLGIYHEQSMRVLHRVQIRSVDKSSQDIVALVPAVSYVFVATKSAVFFLNYKTMRQIIGAMLSGVKGMITCLTTLKNFVFAGTSSGGIFIWKNDVLRTGGEEKPFTVIQTSVGCIRSLCFPDLTLMYCAGEGGPVEYSLKMTHNQKFEHEEKKLKATCQIGEMVLTSKADKCYTLGISGEVGYFT